MPMKPRTFRRVVLLGSLGAIVLLLLFGYFVVRPWQNQRQLEAMRTDGLAAFDAGDLKTAEKLLGRYKNNAENPDAEVFLKHARAREKVEVTDNGHIAVAIASYREYLRRVPSDIEAKRDLLELMNMRGDLFVEAEALARELIDSHGADDLEVLKELQFAMQMQQKSLEDRAQVLQAMYEHPDADFEELSLWVEYLDSTGRAEEANAMLAERVESGTGSVNEQVLYLTRRSNEDKLSDQVILAEICSIIGLDPDANDGLGEWSDDAPEVSPSAGWFINKVFNALRRTDLATTMQFRIARESGDRLTSIWASRRLYWAGRDEELMSLEVRTDNAELDADVLGYQFLSAKRAGDEEEATRLEQAIRDIQFDRRASAWIAHIEADRAVDESRFVDARLLLQNTIDWYSAEPTFRLRVGQQHLSEGRFHEAIEQWITASELANDQIGALFRFDVMGWTEPMIRIVNAYSGQDRLLEATPYIEELQRIAPNDPRTAMVMLDARAELARRGELPRSMGLDFVRSWNANKDAIEPINRAQFAPQVVAILTFMRETELARDELRAALAVAGTDGALKARLLEIDDQYRLGVAATLGIDLSDIAMSSPLGALRAAGEIYEKTGDLDRGIEIIREGMAQADESARTSWERALIGFVDEYSPERARPMWDAMIASSPDDLEVLYFAIESNAYGGDLAKVDELIARAVAMTESEGKAIPARLRLARANAMVAGPDARTNTNRSSALEIVRSVVAQDPSYTKARNMLGRLLSLPPSPGLSDKERYTPDYAGAIEQYRMLARQLDGRVAQDYMIESVDLAYRRLRDTRLATSLLDEYMTLFGDDLDALPSAAIRYENIGQDAKAASIYEQLIAQRDEPAAALSLAELRIKQGQMGDAKSLLARVNQRASLNAANLLNLAGLYVRTGNLPEGELVASSGERYGLEPAAALLIHAQFAELYLDDAQELAILREGVADHDDSIEIWKRLIRRTIELGELNEAQALYARAKDAVREDSELARLGVLARGAPQTAREMLELPGMQESPALRQALERVDAYSTLDANVDAQTRVSMLRQLIEDFPQNEVVQGYAVEQLARVQADASVIAELADMALRNVPSSTGIMGIAGESYLRAGNPDAAIRVIDLWRTNSLETTIVANAIRARAMIQKNDLQSAQREIEGYVDQAFQTPADPISREVLDAYSYIRLTLGEDPGVSAQRLMPLLAANRDIRVQVWLGLAANVVKDVDVGAEWIRIASGYSDEQDRVYLANAWVTLAFTHERWDQEFGNEALAQINPVIEQGGDVLPHVFTIASRANLILARASSDDQSRSGLYTKVVDLMLAAGEADPSNLMPILDAARYAGEGGLHQRTIEIYEKLLAMKISNDGLNAMISNNLAMTMVRAGLRDDQRSRVQTLVNDATRMQSQIPTYWGTRGWVEIELEKLVMARDSFLTSIQLDASNPEGWVGLAIAAHLLGGEYAEDAARAMERVRDFESQGALNDELRGLLRDHGLEGWANADRP